MQKTKLKAPFGWVGGKTQLARDIIDLIPQEHKTYIEVFGGAGSVLYQKEPSKLEVLNDINSELINLHRAIRNNPQSLSIYLNDLLISREIFNDIKSKHLRGRNNIEKAAFYFYQLTQSFGSKGDNFAMATKSGRKPKNIYRNFKTISERLKGVTIENMSFNKLIPLYDKDDAFFYVDPPYVSTESYYKNTGGFGLKEHEELAQLLSNIKGKFLLSYNDSVIVRELYKGFYIRSTKEIRYTLGANKHGKKKSVNEVFITNY
ncbi:DNA adenine methylase [Aliarcobacter butzleri]|uniref:DNA adenine methylase n=1 Tax=Aliarcobacter butzleri TaxID=28197 RepID=UPI00263C4CEC|nr:DNA adenine methylase [Aliarcobacter butzleri]MDN5090991.1 DNA adenine methylase [Aliarcobacter butzleri]